MSSKQLTMRQLLANMRKADASDLHLKVGIAPVYRVHGDLKTPTGLSPLTAEDTERLITEVLPSKFHERLEALGSVDFSTFQDMEPGEAAAGAAPPGSRRMDRFRCNVFRAGGYLHAAIRRVKPEIPTFESLHLPPIYKKIADETMEGLVLIVGVTGCGKSTTLACMLERINASRSENIVTIEDPVEFNIQSRMSIVSQRELGIDVPTYADALKSVVRQDPDVIFIGELRDHDTVLAAIQAAETGHLVFGSLHTADTMQCFQRLVEFFPRSEHTFIRSSLANSMRAVMSQRLIPANEDVVGSPLIPACEVLINNATSRDKIREGLDADLPAIINAHINDGMVSFTESLARLVESDAVTVANAMEYAPNREQLSSRLKGVHVRASIMTGRAGAR